MNILPITINRTNYNTFGAGSSSAFKQINQVAKSNIIKQVSCITGAGMIMRTLDDYVLDKDVTYCSSNNHLINVCSGNNQGFFIIKTISDFSNDKAKEYIHDVLYGENIPAGGLVNYMNMIKDLKREDIIQKGLKIHTYELNNFVPQAYSINAAKKIGSYLKKDIKPKNLFYLEEDAFYYDAPTKSAYGVNMTGKLAYLSDDVILKCKFITNEKGEAIGFDCEHYDSYKAGTIQTHYTEQQSKSCELKPVADSENNREYAEAFRFGNSEKSYRIKNAIPTVTNHLTKRAGIKNPTENDIQVAKFYDKNKNIVTVICYFDSATGYSYVYSPEGKFQYRLEYNKDPNGNIYSCSSI